MQNKQNVHFSPADIAEILEVNESTIKRWIDKGFLEAHKTPGGHRRIQYDQLSEFVQSYPQFAPESYVMQRLLTTKDSEQKSIRAIEESFEEILEKGSLDDAFRFLQKHWLAGIPVPTLLDDIAATGYAHIRKSLADKTISVYEERKMMLALRGALTQFGSMLQKAKRDSQATATPISVVAACIRREYEEMPIHFMTPVFYARGAAVQNLGMNISNSAIIDQLHTSKLTYLLLHHSQKSQFVYGCFFRLVTSARKHGVHVICFGKGWNSVLWRRSKKMSGVTFVHTAQELDQFLATQ